MINIITMAGRGKRFSDKGYLLPKPLIPVMGKPMVWKVIDCLPPASKWFFIVREEHIRDFKIDEVIKERIPDAVVLVDRDLLGGVSIFCAENLIPPDEDVLIAGCDAAFMFDEKKFELLKKENNCILWTFTKDDRLRANPKSWGYAVLDEDGQTINDMSVKVPISDDPYYDHVVTATFYISSARLLYEGIRKIISDDMKANNEYYLDMLPVAFNRLGKKSVIFDVDFYIGWGTPEEFEKFEAIHAAYEAGTIEESGEPEENISKWKEYFGRN